MIKIYSFIFLAFFSSQFVIASPTQDRLLGSRTSVFLFPGCAHGMLGVLTHNCDGFVEGASHALQETIAGIRDAILHPLDTAEALGQAILHADKVAAQIAESVAEVLSEFPEYSASEKGALIGELTVELANILTSGAGLKVGSRLAKIAAESKYGSKVVEAIVSGSEKAGVAKSSIRVEQGKYDYLFGKTKGTKNAAHNEPRAKQNAMQMQRLGVDDTPAGRKLLEEHFEQIIKSDESITKTFKNDYGNYEVRESLFSGPSGKFAKFETTCEVLPDGTRRIVTVIPKGGN